MKPSPRSEIRIDELHLPASLRGRRGLIDAIRAEIERSLAGGTGDRRLDDVRVPLRGVGEATPDHRVGEHVARSVSQALGSEGR